MSVNLQYPQINLNGADGLDLARQYAEAAQAVENAVEKMGRLVHGRDYQTAGVDAYRNAVEQMRDRIRPMVAIYNDLRDIAENCVDQVGVPTNRIG